MLKQFYLNYFLHLDYREDTDLVSKVLSIQLAGYGIYIYVT